MKKKIDELIDKLSGPGTENKIDAVKELGRSGNRKAVKPLIDLLDSTLGEYDKRFLTSAVVQALGDLGAKEAEEVLLKAIDSRLFFVKEAAAEAVGEIRSKGKAADKLKNILYSDEPGRVKKKAIKGISKIEDENVIVPLTDVARKTPQKELKKEAIKALGDTKKAEAVVPLIDIYHEEADVKLRKDVVFALSRIATAGSVEFLIQSLNDRNPEIRSCAALALGETGSQMADMPLQLLLTDPVEKVRESAAKALGLIRFLPK